MSDELYVNEVQTITGTPSAIFGLIFDGAATAATIPIAATAAQIQAALEALPNVGVGNVVAAGGALPTAVTVTFSGSTVAGRDVPQLLVQGATTGLTFATTTPGTGYGVVQTPTRFLEFVDESVKLTIDRVESKAIRANNRVLRSDRWAAGKRQAGGDLGFEVGSKGFAALLGHCLGKAPVITTPAGGTLTRDHTITLGDEWNRSFTLQIGTPTQLSDAANVKPFTYVGCKVTDWELNLDVDGILTLKCTIDARDETLAVSLATASYASAFELFYFVQGSATIAGANVDITKFSLKGKQSYKQDRFYLQSGGLKKQPIANDLIEVTGDIELDFLDTVAYQRYTSGTVFAVTLLCQSNTIIEGITGGNASPGLLITLPVVRPEGDTPDVSGADVLMQAVPFKVLNDGVNEPVTLRYRSTDLVS
ncbi:MAG: hypothetical protein H0X39_16855 [Actinobacteria bacterium]|nr:hypothetical protein [Actinomycetota bacterium]